MILILFVCAILCISSFLDVFNLFESGDLTTNIDRKLNLIYCKLFVAFVLNVASLLLFLLAY